MADAVQLESEELSFFVSPHGATIAGLRAKGPDGTAVDLMRFSPQLTSFFDGGWIMAPYVGRVMSNDGRPGVFRFLGEEYTLGSGEFRERDFSIHGPCCRLDWQLTAHTQARAELLFRTADNPDSFPELFPFSFSLRILYILKGPRLSCEAILRNEDTRAMPAAIGWHPFWERHLPGGTGEVEVSFRATGYYPKKNDMLLPEGSAEELPPELDFSTLKAVPYELDHGFVGVEGPLIIRWPGSGYQVSVATGQFFKHSVIYSPREGMFGDRLAIEWQSSASNAYALFEKDIPDNGLRTLQRGESLKVGWSLDLQRG